MRRPHPRFDSHRNAWVTNAGGRLKTLAKGPKNAATEKVAWQALYDHMSRLGRPVEGAPEFAITLGDLADEYGRWMEKEVRENRLAPTTMQYYRSYIQKFLDAVGGHRSALSILPIEMERYKSGWHSVQTIQRLYNWGVKMGLVTSNPFKEIENPEPAQRERVLDRSELARLLRATDRPFRLFLTAMIHTIARPQEVRAFQWKHLVLEPVPMFVLKDYKAKRLRNRRDRKKHRQIALDDRMVRLLHALAQKRNANPEDYVFLNGQGNPWTGNAVRCRMRRLRRKVGLIPDENGEEVVAYSLRHTSATRACVNGVRDKLLAELMGHTRTSTTERYQHPQADDLHDALKRANRRPTQ